MNLAVVHPDRSIRQAPHRLEVMRHEENRHALLLHLLDASHAALLKENVADRKRLVDDEDIGIKMDRDGKRQANEHAARIRFYRPVDEVADFRKLFNRRDSSPGLGVGEAEYRGIKIDVLAPRKLRIETGPQFQKR